MEGEILVCGGTRFIGQSLVKSIEFVKCDARDMRRLWSSHEQAKALLGDKPEIPLEPGLKIVLEHTQRTDRKGEK